ncbi:asparagine synthetase B [Escherichia coli]|uniref:Asparagine synthetase B n=1 Tax=Escherichia coli TaxID=562 RepID=A0A376TKT9_ECOLX|nr:asparagine synthetase B [Escherichia coli]
MRINPQDKMCGNGKMEKHILRECFESYLPASVAWRQKEQFSDGVGYSWIDTLKEVAAQQVSDQQLGNCPLPLPVQHANLKRSVSVPGESLKNCSRFRAPLSACLAVLPSRGSSAKAIEWDEAFKKMDDPSGRAVGVHQSAYK